MSPEALGWLGIVLTVVLGVAALLAGAKYAVNKRKTKSQSQKVGSGGFAIQSGRDTKIKSDSGTDR
jgi:hypothetical protein